MDFSEVLLAIPSPRDLEQPIRSLEEIDYVDKLWVKYMRLSTANDVIRKFFLEKNYEVLVLVSDDLILPYYSVAQLIHDLARHPDIKVLSGVCNLGSAVNFDFRKKIKTVITNILQWRKRLPILDEAFDENYNLRHINIAFEPVISSESDKIWSLSQYRFPNSQVIFDEERIHKVWFQGFAVAAIRREVVESIPFRSYEGKRAGPDLAFALDCHKAGIEMYADYNIVTPHHQHYDKILVGKRSAYTKFDPRRRQTEV
ncbi:MAG: hypothetical protein ABSD49_11080 [Candidatus Bathyarchaeia archaeon]|jgi:hypothetical protein